MNIPRTPYQFRCELTDEQKTNLTNLATAVAQGIEGLKLVGHGFYKTISKPSYSIAANIGERLGKKHAHPVYECVTEYMKNRTDLIKADVRAELNDVFTEDFIQRMEALVEYADADQYGDPKTLERWGHRRLLTHYLRATASLEDDIDHLCGFGWTLEYSLKFLRIYYHLTGNEPASTHFRDDDWDTSTEKLREYHIKFDCQMFMSNVIKAACKDIYVLDAQVRRGDFLVREDGAYRLTAPARAMFTTSIEIPETHNNPTLRVMKAGSCEYVLEVLEEDGWEYVVSTDKLREVCVRLETSYARHLKEKALLYVEGVRRGNKEPDNSPEFAKLCEFYNVKLVTAAEKVTLYRVLHNKHRADEVARLTKKGQPSYDVRDLNVGLYVLSNNEYDMEKSEGYRHEIAVFPNLEEARKVHDKLYERQLILNRIKEHKQDIEKTKALIEQSIKDAGEYDKVYQKYGAPFEEEDVKAS